MASVADLAQLSICVGGSVALSAYTARHWLAARTLFNSACLAACLVFLAETAVILTYALVLFLNPPTRYVFAYIGVNGPFALLYLLYVRRLSTFFVHGAAAFRAALYALIAFNAATTITIAAVLAAASSNTSTGGYATSGPYHYPLKLCLYFSDISIGAAIFAGTLVSLGRIVAGRNSSRVGAVSLYSVILYSDCVKFLFVLGIEIYKAYTCYDPSNQAGALPNGNLGFQHLVDLVKMCIMVINLYLPSGISNLISSSADHRGPQGVMSATVDDTHMAPKECKISSVDSGEDS
ncbi:hypothetical protein HK405_012898 [Cladochytrium tenue]|nr:hypothetical protein HK405_012898 [Cladochytrium tenue]